MKNLSATLAIVWRIAVPYFRSEDKWAGRGLLAVVVAMELVLVAINVLLNQWQNRFYSALQAYDLPEFVKEVWIFLGLAFTFVALAVYKLYLNQWLQIRWRQWLTQHYLGEWLEGATHYRMQLRGDAADNPDQRITEDVKNFVEQTLTIGLGLLSSIVTLASFVVILWGLSYKAPLYIYGTDILVPGFLVWCALAYAIVGTALTHWIGAPLINLNFEQQRFEADFRFNLIRVRENSEQIALLKGENAERGHLLRRFGFVIGNWYEIMGRTKRLTAFTASYGQAATLFPYVVVAPAYFAKRIQLGDMMQTGSAFGSVQDALSFFVTAYRSLAEWRAVIARLDGFEMSVSSAAHGAALEPTIDIAPSNGKAIALEQLLVKLPNGAPLVAADAFTIQPSERVLVTGPSGSGKSTLFRAIAGVWPFGTGTIAIPETAKLMMLPQRPYFPIGALGDAVIYPTEHGSVPPEKIRDALIAVGLPRLADRLDEHGHWNRTLSLGEQQRLGLARALLHMPDYLFLDEATASLDEPSEDRLYRLLTEKLPQATIVSIGHRSTLDAFHTRKVALVEDGEIHVLGKAVEPARAEPTAAR
ncbi:MULTISPECIES: ABC transporter ATP-binding protein/permease [Bradyrhizobium]|uniref:ABC transporter ATP-binding protein/permease n=1 Tax=Bradyrhizobium ottawaense TaxID=931866 RepID=A0A2U8P8F8_9BRAD|nr:MULTISPECIES: ABC transporter ATP-binding protein/permease [Bradyrhizobium]AWL93744.1 ABC transporter ATP-binding protein/permease [Bradyrhizobium ottawaense]MBR1328421.1 ABC transporter ATP-binding protein/permease [Bradyrhizobium ottawaense]MBR1334170.1 ABC transporter ATP-binding protein/permease [Bradyrhizobium ottawaense]MBR1360920.1 ABC transporter ATP-binding protein/permease [Bradyrhizobium ottawaense]MDA9447327.1 ABC transporter ATP-binding protein [Bradyrhizobium sp. CCBAU 21360]